VKTRCDDLKVKLVQDIDEGWIKDDALKRFDDWWDNYERNVDMKASHCSENKHQIFPFNFSIVGVDRSALIY
jgi:hypothetical protein